MALPLPCPRQLLVVDLQDGQEGLLRNLDGADLLHALLARLLLFQQLLLARDIAAVALGQHVLAQRLDVFAGDDVGADRGLDRHVVHLARNDLAHLGRDFAPAILRIGSVHDHRQRIDLVAVDQDIDLDHVGRAIFLELVVHRRVAARDRLQAVEEIEHDFRHRDFVGQLHLLAVVAHVDLRAALLRAQRDHRADIFLRHVQVDGDDRLQDGVDLARVRHLGRIFHGDGGAVAHLHLVDHRRRGGDQVHVELALQALLHDLHVQQAQEAAAEAEAQRLRHFGLEHQRGIVETQLFQRLAQCLVLIGFHRIQAGEHLRLDFLEARQRRFGLALHGGEGIANLGGLQFLDAGNDKAHLPSGQRVALDRLGREHAHLLDQVLRAGGHQQHLVLGAQRAVDHAHQHHHADVVVEPRVDDQRLQRCIGIALGRRHLGDQRLDHVLHALAGLGRAWRGILRVDADDILDLLDRAVRVRLRQVDLVQHRHHFHAQLDRGVAVGHGLGLDALRGIDHQQRAFAGGQRAADFIAEVDVSGGVDQVQVIDLAVARLVAQRGGLRLDGDAALFFDIHRIENLRFHLPIRQPSTKLNDPVGQGGLPMVDVGNDREITDMVHLVFREAPAESPGGNKQ
ncbi:hypothetical protein CBM2588_A130033 [Cupriavidus taiwanensis]|nr:hypothetical protein CBM2588_A130033 [Cupriavidus taiwanensis]